MQTQFARWTKTNIEEFACASPSASNSVTVPSNGSSAEKNIFWNIVGI
jgi:hypothetical protein